MSGSLRVFRVTQDYMAFFLDPCLEWFRFTPVGYDWRIQLFRGALMTLSRGDANIPKPTASDRTDWRARDPHNPT